MSVVETLTKAKEIIIERGINRDGGFINTLTGCSVCALGALKLAVGGEVKNYNEGVEGDPDFDISLAPGGNWNAFSEAQRALNKALPDNEWIPSFNDASTDDQQVIDLFDRAIELVEQ